MPLTADAARGFFYAGIAFSVFLRQNSFMRNPGPLIFLIRIGVLLAALVLLFSCAADKEIVAPLPASPIKEHQPPVAKPAPVAPAPELKASLQCLDDTEKFFNRCGIDAFPFLRMTFYDIDGDGADEMIVGGKDGGLRLFKNYGSQTAPGWRIVENYFRGINVGAFSSPAVGDIDGDGRPEVIVGTGGFSSDSGRVLIFKNAGTLASPQWKRAEMPEIRVGNDAAPALLDADNNGRPDLVVGNSEGRLFLFRNRSNEGKIVFIKDRGFLDGVRLGMYVVPAAARAEGRAVIIAGNDLGKLYLIEKAAGRTGGWTRTLLKISTQGFASPSLSTTPGARWHDLLVSDGDGQIYYYKNKKGNYREWEVSAGPFADRILVGPACAPVLADNGDGNVVTIGNIHGEMKLFVQDRSGAELPVERKNFFSGLRLTGFSKGVLTEWQGKALLVTGQQDGSVRAFLNSGGAVKPTWTEVKHFFRGIPTMMHASPAVFDLRGDGKWELIVGDAQGNVRGFRYEIGRGGLPQWEEMKGIFDDVKVDGYAAPTIFREGDRLSLLVGELDGRIRAFEANAAGNVPPVFHKNGFLKDIRMKKHSSPSALAKGGFVEIAVGDYDGNLRHYSCNRVSVEAKDEASQ